MKKLTILEAIDRTGLTKGVLERFVINNKHMCYKAKIDRHWQWLIPVDVVDKLAEEYKVPADWLSTTQAANLCKVKSTTIHSWCANGYFTATKTPTREWYIEPESLNAFLERREESRKRQRNWSSGGGGDLLHLKTETTPNITPPAIEDSDTKAPEAWRTNYRRGKRSGVYCADIEGKRVGNATAVNDFERVHG